MEVSCSAAIYTIKKSELRIKPMENTLAMKPNAKYSPVVMSAIITSDTKKDTVFLPKDSDFFLFTFLSCIETRIEILLKDSFKSRAAFLFTFSITFLKLNQHL